MPSQPNILVIFAEQHRGDCLSSEGHPVLLTPNMDAIGGYGTRFTHAYTTCPVCVPARRSLISGQFPATHGAFTNCGTEWDPEHTIASVLRDAGYQTGWVGRSMHQYPVRKRFGFEELVHFDHREPGDYDEFLARNMPEGGNGYWGSGVMHNDWTARPFHLPEELHATNWTMYEAQRFLDRRDPTRPFFLVVSQIASHPPLVPPAFYLERYLRTGVPEPYIGDWAQPPENAGIGLSVDGTRPGGGDPALARWTRNAFLTGERLLSARAGYYGLINHLDDQIRRLLNGILGGVDPRRTVIVYTADHGEMLGDHYQWAKSVPYEGSTRIPFLMRVPEALGFPHGQVLDQPVCLEDVMPTLLELADVPIPGSVEGRSLVPLLRGESPPWRDYLHIECSPMHHTLTDGVEKYCWFVPDGREQFFRLDDDPGECHDLAGDPDEAERVAYWRSLLIQELAGREEGFTDGDRLIAGRPYPACRR
jgi:arylsulfatase A-like enzyme